MILKQMSYIGSNGGTNDDCAEVLELIAAGTVSSKVATVGFDDIDQSIARFERGETNGRLVAVRD